VNFAKQSQNLSKSAKNRFKNSKIILFIRVIRGSFKKQTQFKANFIAAGVFPRLGRNRFGRCLKRGCQIPSQDRERRMKIST
jgi:hypothetical protein